MTARRRYYRVLAQIARRTGGIYVDMGKPMGAKARALYRQHPLHTVYSDGGHLNAIGSMIVAMEVVRALGVDLAATGA